MEFCKCPSHTPSVRLALLVAGFGLLLSKALGAVESTHSGSALAQVHCQRCHSLPTPDLLGKEDWREVMKRMASFLGVARPNFEARPEGPELKASGLFPPQPLVSSSEWDALVAHYVDAAPVDVATQPARPKPQKLQLFKPRDLIFSTDAPCTSLLQLDARTGGLWVG